MVMSSTWLISWMPTPWMRSLNGFASPRALKTLEEILHHRAHLSELAAEALLKNVGSGRIDPCEGGDRVDRDFECGKTYARDSLAARKLVAPCLTTAKYCRSTRFEDTQKVHRTSTETCE